MLSLKKIRNREEKKEMKELLVERKIRKFAESLIRLCNLKRNKTIRSWSNRKKKKKKKRKAYNKGHFEFQ